MPQPRSSNTQCLLKAPEPTERVIAPELPMRLVRILSGQRPCLLRAVTVWRCHASWGVVLGADHQVANTAART